ncbi:MAG: NADP-dependent isocitrate dehydrogenase [Spirochaetaceae bacterium]
MSTAKKISVARGDGIGPEIMDATLKILEAAAAPVEPEFIEIGREVFLQGYSAGIRPDAWESIRRTKTLLKAPVTTPQGAGYKSLNVTIRKTLGLFANVRPCQSLNPYVETHHPTLDIIIVRENEEDLYAGIEHAQTEDVTQCLKLISRPGSERVIRYAFEYAQQYGRRKVTCMIKDNIMKVTDGLFHRVFDEVAAEYPEIETDQQIIDIGTARLATEPERYDVIVTPNLYGDIISDVVAEVSGSVGMAGSANVGTEMAMFEAIHGSAPDIAGRNIANPSGLINAAVMMLVHLGEPDHADTIHNAWLKAIEDGQHTAEIYREGRSEHMLGTEEFARAVIDRLGEKPRTLRSWHIDARRGGPVRIPPYQRKVRKKELVGSDLFIDWQRDDPEAIGKELDRLSGDALKLKMITNRGVKVYPNGFPETFCTDHWRCRFVGRGTEVAGENTSYEVIDHKALTQLIDRLNYAGYEVIKTENLYLFDGERGFSLGQGE